MGLGEDRKLNIRVMRLGNLPSGWWDWDLVLGWWDWEGDRKYYQGDGIGRTHYQDGGVWDLLSVQCGLEGV